MYNLIGKSFDYNSDQQMFIEDVMFKVSVKGVNKVLFERESFANIRLTNTTTFQVQVANFDQVMLGRSSFSGVTQQRASNFELNLSNGQDISLAPSLFSNLIQSEKAKFVVYFGLDSTGLVT